ncbi:hypothetical protein CC79DRAFT_1178948 [Sarocladium strictum]
MVRLTLSRALLGLPVLSTVLAMTNDTQEWWQKPFGMVHPNLREIDADMDTDEVADWIQAHGASAWLQSVGGIIANYPTDLDFQVINPLSAARASGDLVGDTVKSGRERGIRVLGRMDFSKLHREVAELHPDWLYVSPKGNWQNHTNDLVSACPSGEYYQERIFDILGEVVDRYGLDGFFVNWAGMNERDYFRVYHGVCHCKSCQRGWAKDHGDEEMPTGPESENYNDWKIWSDGVVQKWTAKVSAFLAERAPGAGLIRFGAAADVMFYEPNNALDREIWHHATSEAISTYKSANPDKPVLANCASFLDHAYRITPENKWHYEQYHLQAMSRGANPSSYIIGYPGRIPWSGLDAAGDLMRFYRDQSDVYAGMRPIAKTGLVLPQEVLFKNATRLERARSEFKGLYKSLQELHVPFDVISQLDLLKVAQSESIDRYEVVILPNLGAIGADDAEALDDWVARGGTLIVTGKAGVETDHDPEDDEEENDTQQDNGSVGLQLQSLPASQRLTYTDTFEDLWSMYFATEQNRTEENQYEGTILPLIGSYSTYDWNDDAHGLYKKLGYAPFAPPEYIYGNTQVDERGAGFGSYDNGTGVIVSFPVGYGYRETGLETFRDFFEELLDVVGADEPLEFDLHQDIEVTLNINEKGQMVVHLINMSGIRYQNFGPYVPMPAGSFKVKRGGDGVTAKTLKTGLELEIEENGTVKLPGFELFDLIVIEGLDT